MRRNLLAVCVVVCATLVPCSAHALCLVIPQGTVYLNIRTGSMRGINFKASVNCTRFTPATIEWGGGRICAGRRFFGWTYEPRKSFSCLVRSIKYKPPVG
jgi:hypothetical protein